MNERITHDYEKKDINSNVINSKETIQSIVDGVVNLVADATGVTLGPYGKTVLIQSGNTIVRTKDGWNIFQSLKTDSPIVEAFKGAIMEACGGVAIHGDGTTTLLQVARSAVLNLIHSEELQHVHIRDIENGLNEAIELITEAVQENSLQLTDENRYDVIRNIAMTSTNGDEELTQLIVDSIKETGNPHIEIKESGLASTYNTILKDSFSITGNVELEHFINYPSEAMVKESKPLVLIIDGEFDETLAKLLCHYIAGAKPKRPIITMAAAYSVPALQTILGVIKARYDKGEVGFGTYVVPLTYRLANTVDKLMLRDLAMLNGCEILSEGAELTELTTHAQEIDSILHSIATGRKTMSELSESEYSEKLTYLQGRLASLFGEVSDQLVKYLGTCGTITAVDATITCTGLYNKNENLYELTCAKAEAFAKKKAIEGGLGAQLSMDVHLRNTRISKLKCNSATIFIGGNGEGNIKARKDALEDAVKACVSVWYDGYNPGFSVAVPKAIASIRATGITNPNVSVFCDILEKAYRDSARQVVINAGRENDIVNFDGIMDNAIHHGCAYNVLTCEMDTEHNVINPTNTDLIVLRNVAALVLLLATSENLTYAHLDDKAFN